MYYENLFKKWLLAANSYYCPDEFESSLMEDVEWDMLGRELAKNWDKFEHPLKAKFEDEDGNPIVHTAYHLTPEDYNNV